MTEFFQRLKQRKLNSGERTRLACRLRRPRRAGVIAGDETSMCVETRHSSKVRDDEAVIARTRGRVRSPDYGCR